MNYSKKSIVPFDIRAENSRFTELDNDICDNMFDYNLIKVMGKIAFLDC